nr:hypothetical protein Iba_chr09bCG8500 [Ipomoea batatas]
MQSQIGKAHTNLIDSENPESASDQFEAANNQRGQLLETLLPSYADAVQSDQNQQAITLNQKGGHRWQQFGFSKSFSLFFQRLHVLLEIVDSVLLAQRSHAQEKNSGHREELNEAVLSLHCVGEKAERLLSASYAAGEGGARRRCSGGHGDPAPSSTESKGLRKKLNHNHVGEHILNCITRKSGSQGVVTLFTRILC